MRSALVFGGAGQLGVAIAERLLSSGWDVSVVTREGRTPPRIVTDGGATVLDGTGKSRAEMIGQTGRSIDGVFDPTAYDEADAQDLLRARQNCGGFVVISSASVYADPNGRSLIGISQSGMPKPDGPISEDAPTVDPGAATYATRKASMEQALLVSEAPVSVLRPCAIYGTHSNHPREWWFVKRALDGRGAIPVAYQGQSVFHTSSARDVADLAALCLEQPARRVLNVADRTALSVSGIAAAIADATGLILPLRPFEGAPIGPAHIGSTPWSCEHPIVLDTTQAVGLGWDGGEYRERVAPFCRWILDVARAGDWRAQFSQFSDYGYDPFDYAAEDGFLAGR